MGSKVGFVLFGFDAHVSLCSSKVVLSSLFTCTRRPSLHRSNQESLLPLSFLCCRTAGGSFFLSSYLSLSFVASASRVALSLFFGSLSCWVVGWLLFKKSRLLSVKSKTVWAGFGSPATTGGTHVIYKQNSNSSRSRCSVFPRSSPVVPAPCATQTARGLSPLTT